MHSARNFRAYLQHNQSISADSQKGSEMKTVVSLSEVILSMERRELACVSLYSVRAIRVAVVWCCEPPAYHFTLIQQ